jgi:hypothetical protein
LQLLQLQQQLQLQEQQQAAAALLGQHNLNAYGAAGLTSMGHGLQQLQMPAAAAARAGSPSGMLLPSSSSGMAAQGVGQYSSSFAFGAPGLSAFAPLAAGANTTSSTAATFGGRSSEPGTGSAHVSAAAAAAARERSGASGAGSAGSSNEQQRQAVYDALAQLPDDLGFSPPSPGPAGRLAGRGRK